VGSENGNLGFCSTISGSTLDCYVVASSVYNGGSILDVVADAAGNAWILTSNSPTSNSIWKCFNTCTQIATGVPNGGGGFFVQNCPNCADGPQNLVFGNGPTIVGILPTSANSLMQPYGFSIGGGYNSIQQIVSGQGTGIIVQSGPNLKGNQNNQYILACDISTQICNSPGDLGAFFNGSGDQSVSVGPMAVVGPPQTTTSIAKPHIPAPKKKQK
jgi:hypothetical protein